MQSKGRNVEGWNWQARDKQDGIFPSNEEEKNFDENFDLDQELSKIDESSGRKKERSPFRPLKSNTQVY